MKVYRISKEKYIKDLSGTGAKLYGGRWNPKGYPLLYTSENKSLAALEVLVHLDRATIPEDLKIITLHLPDDQINLYDVDKFKKIMLKEDANVIFKEEGKLWIESALSLGLKIPSVLVSGENNIIINPQHSSFENIQIETIEDFIFDERFFI